MTPGGAVTCVVVVYLLLHAGYFRSSCEQVSSLIRKCYCLLHALGDTQSSQSLDIMSFLAGPTIG